MVRWLMKYCSCSYSSFICWKTEVNSPKQLLLFNRVKYHQKSNCDNTLLLVSIPFFCKYQETLRILEISICKYDIVLCLSWCGNIFEVHFKTGTLVLFDDKSLGNSRQSIWRWVQRQSRATHWMAWILTCRMLGAG